jgi:hypothetical protein
VSLKQSLILKQVLAWIILVMGMQAGLAKILIGLMSWYALAINNHFIYSFQSLRQILRVGLIGLLEPMGYRQRDAFWRMKA